MGFETRRPSCSSRIRRYHEAIPMGFETDKCGRRYTTFVIMKPSLWDLKRIDMLKWQQAADNHEAIPMGFETPKRIIEKEDGG